MDERKYSDRLMSIPGSIYEIGLYNPAVNNIIGMYAREDIITLQEMLCQMIVRLNKDAEYWKEELLKHHRNAVATPTVIPSSDRPFPFPPLGG